MLPPAQLFLGGMTALQRCRSLWQARRSYRACNPPGRLQNTSSLPHPTRGNKPSSKRVCAQGRSEDGRRASPHLLRDRTRGLESRHKLHQPWMGNGGEACSTTWEKGAKGAGVRQGQGLAGDERHGANPRQLHKHGEAEGQKKNTGRLQALLPHSPRIFTGSHTAIRQQILTCAGKSRKYF